MSIRTDSGRRKSRTACLVVLSRKYSNSQERPIADRRWVAPRLVCGVQAPAWANWDSGSNHGKIHAAAVSTSAFAAITGIRRR